MTQSMVTFFLPARPAGRQAQAKASISNMLNHANDFKHANACLKRRFCCCLPAAGGHQRQKWTKTLGNMVKMHDFRQRKGEAQGENAAWIFTLCNRPAAWSMFKIDGFAAVSWPAGLVKQV